MIRDLKRSLGDFPEEVILACVNYGYAASGIVENWAASVANVGLGEHVLIVTLDDRAQAVLNSRGIPACRWNSDRFQDTAEKAMPFTGNGWREVTFSKLQLVHEVLSSGKDVLFSDADIVFKEDPLPFLRSLGTSVAVQSDVPVSGTRDDDWSRGTLCSGFYFARSCEETIRIFDGSRQDFEDFERDQLLLHHRLIAEREAPTVVLPRQVFPNGSYWKERRPVDPHVIHYNWCRGLDRKVQWMKEDGNWWVDAGVREHPDSPDPPTGAYPDKHTYSPTVTNKLREDLAVFAREFREPSYLEVGFDRGYTLASLARTFSKLRGIDSSPARVADAKSLLQRNGITNVIVSRGDSVSIPPGRYDVVLIDASHTYQDVRRDTINVLARNIDAERFVVVFHDYGLVEAGVRRFCDEYFGSVMIPVGEEADWNPLGGATDGPEAVACTFDRTTREEFLARLSGESRH